MAALRHKQTFWDVLAECARPVENQTQIFNEQKLSVP
jgi:hypothetical protein